MTRHRIALIAHDGKKDEMIRLVDSRRAWFSTASLVATATTGTLIAETLDLDVDYVASGPLGGDLQIGAQVAAGLIDMVVFLRDPLTAHPHDPDIQALMKVCDVYHIPLATNTASARLCLDALHQRTTAPEPTATHGGTSLVVNCARRASAIAGS